MNWPALKPFGHEGAGRGPEGPLYAAMPRCGVLDRWALNFLHIRSEAVESLREGNVLSTTSKQLIRSPKRGQAYVWHRLVLRNRMGIAALLLAALLFGLSASLQAQKRPAPRWKPATYRGLTVGLSSKEDVLRVLGKPASVSRDSESGEPLWDYRVTAPFPGTLEAYIKHGTTLGGFTLTPSSLVTRAEAVKLFGSNYHYSRHSTPAGPLDMLAYPDRGITIILEFENDEAVDLIIYSPKPVNPH